MADTHKLRASGVYIFSEDNTRILLIQRGTGARHEYFKWEGPGGKCESGESFEDCARREVREELAVDVELTAIIGEHTAITDSKGTLWEAKIFTGRITGTPVIQEPDKCAGFGWFTPDEVRHLDLADYVRENSYKDLQQLGWL